MFGIEQLKDFMEEEFGVAVKTNAVGEETVLLYHEELDEQLILEDVLQILPNPVLFQTYIYNDESEWIIGIALEAETNNPLFLVCLKDEVKVYEKLLNKGEKSMNEQRKPRYMTRAISEKISIEMQTLLWELLDSIAVQRKDKMDYLQVFEFVNINKKIKIINSQEQPPIKEEIIIEQGIMNLKDTTIWIIDEPDKQTMLFPSDY
ncbi:DUF960 family protein [Neobacillus sp. NPDC097160]|uniref:DUF960 family protein n=1 Tax=Neobacillus sp. NPDC097160 TaxID=3364298 RepID=UPI003807EE94